MAEIEPSARSQIMMVPFQYFNLFTNSISRSCENSFHRLGVNVAMRPLWTVALTMVLTVLLCSGLFNFRQEKNPLKLWVPSDSAFVRDTEWLINKYQLGYRVENMILAADNVLEPWVIKKLLYIDRAVSHTATWHGTTWQDFCVRIPYVSPWLLEKLNLNVTSVDWSTRINQSVYCAIVHSLKRVCLQKSLLQIWEYNEDIIKNLSYEDIVNNVNQHEQRALLFPKNSIIHLLGNITTNTTGHIIGATALENSWMIQYNLSQVKMDAAGNLVGTADWASTEVLEWEALFESIMNTISQNMSNSTLYFSSGRSFGDVTNAALFQDMKKLSIGIIIMIIYILVAISRFNWLEFRTLLGLCGLLSVAMAFVSSCGLCSMAGIPYGPVHTSLPFLLMGLGVDDMLVMMACWDELSATQMKLTFAQKFGVMLKNSGISIMVTSVTDVLAFLIGSFTVLPCLESFCIYAAVGVLMTFLFAITFFVACFALDQRRLEARFNAVVPCVRHADDYKPNSWSKRNITQKVFQDLYSNVILTKYGKIVVFLITTLLLGLSGKHLLNLRQKFDPLWFVPQDTSLAKFLNAKDHFYPLLGHDGAIYVGAVNYTHEFGKLLGVANQLNSMHQYVFEVNDWLRPFRAFTLKNYNIDLYTSVLDEDTFFAYLSTFLFSPQYAHFQANILFEDSLNCGSPTPPIKMSNIAFRFPHWSEPEEYLPGMHYVNQVAKETNLTTGDRHIMAWCKQFATWTTDELIDTEVKRNLILALICVMTCTVLLVANLWACFWIFTCVLFTMVNVCGFMAMWGLTIDLVTCIGLELAIGLCVDYATHIGHTYLKVEHNSRDERAMRTVSTIGLAVILGALSTLIGVLMFAFSDAYTFQVFFKIFLLVVVFGLFHGVIFLPVALSIFGPIPYKRISNACDIPLKACDENNETV